MKTKIHFFQPADQKNLGPFRIAMRKTGELLRERDFWFGLLFFTLMLLLFVGRGEFSVPSYKLGDIAQSTVRSPQDIQIQDTGITERRRKEARERVLPVYDFEPELANTSVSRLHDVFAYIGSRQNPETGVRATAALAREIHDVLNVTVDPSLLSTFLRSAQNGSFENRFLEKLKKIMSSYVVSDRKFLFLYSSIGLTARNVENKREERLEIASVQDMHDVETALRREFEDAPGDDRLPPVAATEFLMNFVAPTLYLNSAETQARVEAAARNTEPVFYQIKKGKVIVRDGEEITPPILALLQAVKDTEHREPPIRYSIGIAMLLILSLVALKKYLTVHRYSDIKLRDKKLFQLCGLVLVTNLMIVRLGLWIAASLSSSFIPGVNSYFFAYEIAVPFAAGALLLTILTDRSVGTLYSFGFAILIGVATQGDFYLALYCLASGVAAANSLRRFHSRSNLLRSGLWIWLVNVLTVFMVYLLRETGLNWFGVAFHVLCALGSALLAVGFASVFVPLLEWMFNITTDIKLLELSNLDLPVLRQLALEAPGTYHHSIVMGTIAEAAAEKVGANPLFLRVAALYHDIGKIRKSEYYVENQRELNKHDSLNPRMSALVIINHVKEGLEVAKLLRLPSDIAAMIPQHHGTRLITYFYKKAKDLENPEVERVREEDYRYPGPKPQTKEGAILMLADATEAASRTLTEPSPSRIQNMVHTIFRAIFEDGQLDESNLTMKDLNLIAEAFVRKLESVFHHRIAYPGFEFNRDEKTPDPGQSEDFSEKMAT